MTTKRPSDHEKSDRPFPWDCPSCGKREVHPATVPYIAELKHDGMTHTVHIPALEIPKCRACGELLFSDRADEQINAAFRRTLKLLTPSQIRRRRRELALKQAQLAERIGAAEGTISRWETGALIQSRTSDNLLRVYFGLPAVRAVLIGEAQNPDLGLADETPADCETAESRSAIAQQFTYAVAAYGEEPLRADIACLCDLGSLLPVGRG
jgi:putative zinc finger/helix-turn-helix YgiT family protein